MSNTIGFEDQLAKAEASLVTDYTSPGNCLLIAFGGIRLGLGMPPFEFFRLTKEMPVKRIYLRDFHQAWYHRGIPEAGPDIVSIANHLKKEIARENITHTVVVGNSMGGFASLLFGCLIGAAHALAFSPQTFLSPFKLLRHRDLRWRKEHLKVYLSRQSSEFYDLKPLVARHPQTKCSIYNSAAEKFDSLHARHLLGLSNVTVHESAEGGHNIIQTLRDTGRLETILKEALSLPS